MSWRRPIYRWNWRMLRIERRQWTLIVALIGITVAAGIVLVTAGLNVSPVNGADRGNATHKFTIEEQPFIEVLADAERTFGEVDAIAVSFAFPAGSGTQAEVRSLRPAGPLVSPLIDLKRGRYPAASGEIASTADQLERLGLVVGDVVALNGEPYDVVGIVENPTDLSAQFFLVEPGLTNPEYVDVLVTTTDQELGEFMSGRVNLSTFIFDSDARTANTLILTILVAAVLVEVALLAAAVLTVVARRRIRQLGMIAAIGANNRQVRSAVVAGGVVAGLLAVTIGVATGVLASLFVIPLLEPLANRRITTVEYPWPAIALVALLALGSAAVAAWWPARKLARMGVAESLRARRPENRVPVRMTALGLVLIVVGAAALIYTFSLTDPDRPFFIDVAAFLAVPIGAVLLAPMAVRILARARSSQRLSNRVALRDMGRYQSRSAATAAALVIILTFPVAGAVGYGIVEQSPDNVPTMAPGHLLVAAAIDESGDEPGADLSSVMPAIDELAATLGAEQVPLTQAVYILGQEEPRPVVRTQRGFSSDEEVSLGSMQPLSAGIITSRRDPDFSINNTPTYVATPALLTALGLNSDAMAGNDVLTNRDGAFGLVDLSDNDVRLVENISVGRADFVRYSRTPGALLAPEYVATLDVVLHNTGWLLMRDAAFTNDDIAAATTLAGRSGLGVEAFDTGINGDAVINAALLVAGLLAIGIVAIVSALHRAETSQTELAYEAIGASAGFRRKVHALTIAFLVAIAAVLASIAGLLSQLGFAKEILGVRDMWRMVPVTAILAVVVLIPLAAYAMAWLGASRERAAVIRA